MKTAEETIDEICAKYLGKGWSEKIANIDRFWHDFRNDLVEELKKARQGR